MASKTKTRGLNLPVPQSREEASNFVRMIGENERQRARIEADMNDAIARIKEDAELRAEPLKSAIVAMTEGLKTWCEANRAALTDGGKVKHHEFAAGKVSWRLRPPKVTIRKAEEVIERIRAMGLKARFLRIAEEIDREAMLRDPDRARGIPGVTIGSEGEEFSVEPFEAALSEVA